MTHHKHIPLTAEDIRFKAFTPVRFGRGYDEDHIDEFLDQVEDRLEQGLSPFPPGRRNFDFPTRLFGGYAITEVDAFIEQLWLQV